MRLHNLLRSWPPFFPLSLFNAGMAKFTLLTLAASLVGLTLCRLIPSPLFACLLPMAGLGVAMAIVARLNEPLATEADLKITRVPERAGLGKILHRVAGYLDVQRIVQTETLHERVFRLAHDAMFIVNGELRFIEANESFCALWGLRRQELFKRTLPEIMAEAGFEQEDFCALLARADFQGEITITSQDGVQRVFDLQAMPISSELYFGIAREVTEKHHCQEEWRRAAEWRELLLRNMNDGLLVIDREGRPLIHNRAAETMLGLPAEEFEKLAVLDGKLAHESQRWALRPIGLEDPFALALHEARKAQDCRAQVYRDDRLVRQLVMNVSPLYDEHQELLGALLALRELSRRDLMRSPEPVFPHARTEPQQIVRLTELVELAASAGHEIINRMTGIISYAQLLQERATAGQEEAALLRGIVDEGERVTGILRHLLAFARPRPHERLITPLEGVIAASLSLMAPRLHKDGIRVHNTAAPGLPPVSCHCQQMQEVFINLLSNAQHALNLKSPSVTTDKTILIHTTLAPSENGGACIRATVTDNGIGIAPEILPVIFAPFFTTKQKDEGTGLGLSLSKQIIQDHGGEIRVQSKLGSHTTFVVELPAVESGREIV